MKTIRIIKKVLKELGLKNLSKNYDENSDKGYFLEVDVEYPKKY